MKKILVTGCKGYIGTVLMPHLSDLGYKVIGTDAGYFEECLLENISENYDFYRGDIRDIPGDLLHKVDIVIHLAGLSNDPLGEFNASLTDDINREASIRLARLAVASGVERFIYISSQSMYGISGDDKEVDEDNSDKNPITAYARTKWEAELFMKNMDKKQTTFTYLRPSTVFGYSPRLRSDIVFNNFICTGLSTGVIKIMSDGSPWRPIIHIKDVARVISACTVQDASLIANRSYNIGIKNGNYRVIELANEAKKLIPDLKVDILGVSTDPRSYRVSFDRLHNEFKNLECRTSLFEGGKDLVENLKRVGFAESRFKDSQTVRLSKLRELVDQGNIDNNLRFEKSK